MTKDSGAILTNHAIDRAKGRVGLSKKAAQRMADKARDEGFTRFAASGSFRRYLDKLYLKYETATHLRVYGLHIYLFTDAEVLITIMHVPKGFRKSAQRLGGKKNG